jgi:hypothetical protein
MQLYLPTLFDARFSRAKQWTRAAAETLSMIPIAEQMQEVQTRVGAPVRALELTAERGVEIRGIPFGRRTLPEAIQLHVALAI